jgi:EAL domain-containing protein (putative c-di-GMP-specific phosphodiesterase class I)
VIAPDPIIDVPSSIASAPPRPRELSQALCGDELSLHYQPIVNLIDGSLTGFEALVRWEHPRLGLIPAGAFVPMAERHGVIGLLDEWVLHAACRQLAEWQDAVLVNEQFVMTVNASASALEERTLVERVGRALAETEVEPTGLIVELTESHGVVSLPLALESANGLHALGVRLAIDDFGSQYSWFSRLSALPFDVLKIDRELIEASDSALGRAIVRAIVELGTSIDTVMIAEGVETEAQLRLLRALGCQEGQGFYWSPPMSAGDTTSLLGGGIWPRPVLPDDGAG